MRFLGKYAYVGFSRPLDDANLYGIQIVDITDSAVPVVIGACILPSNCEDIIVSGDYAYIACYAEGLQILNISDPVNPVIIGTRDTPGSARRVCVYSDYAYLADGDLQIINIADPENPGSLITYNTPGYARDVMVLGEYAYIADTSSGIQILNVEDPASPSFYSSIAVNDANGVYISGKSTYISSSTEFNVVDLWPGN